MAKENKEKTPEEIAAEQAIFGNNGNGDISNTGGLDDKTIKSPNDQSEMISISKTQFETIFSRLNELENQKLSESKRVDDVFNPLAEVKSNYIVRVAFHGDDLVVGYKKKKRPDGVEISTYMKKDSDGLYRTTATLLLADGVNKDGTIKTKEEEVDFVHFLQGVITLDKVCLERKDVGQIVKQGLTSQVMWNGRTMAETGIQVQMGAKEQKWLFTIDHEGVKYTLPEEVINIK